MTRRVHWTQAELNWINLRISAGAHNDADFIRTAVRFLNTNFWKGEEVRTDSTVKRKLLGILRVNEQTTKGKPVLADNPDEVSSPDGEIEVTVRKGSRKMVFYVSGCTVEHVVHAISKLI